MLLTRTLPAAQQRQGRSSARRARTPRNTCGNRDIAVLKSCGAGRNRHARADVQAVLDRGHIRRFTIRCGGEDVGAAAVEVLIQRAAGDRHVSRIEEPCSRLSVRSGGGHAAAADFQIILAGSLDETAVSTLLPAFRADIAEKLRRLVRPDHHVTAVALAQRVGRDTDIGPHVGVSRVAHVGIGPVIIPAHQHAAAAGIARSIDPGVAEQPDAIAEQLDVPAKAPAGGIGNVDVARNEQRAAGARIEIDTAAMAGQAAVDLDRTGHNVERAAPQIERTGEANRIRGIAANGQVHGRRRLEPANVDRLLPTGNRNLDVLALAADDEGPTAAGNRSAGIGGQLMDHALQRQGDRAEHTAVFQRADEKTRSQLIAMPSGRPAQSMAHVSCQRGNKGHNSHWL